MQTRAVAKSDPGSASSIEVRSEGPFSTGAILWRDEAGRVLATVVAKATYNLAQGTSEIVETPDPIRHPDEYWDDGAAESLRCPSDLAPFKAAHEVLVVGHVYTESGRPAKAATARIVIGDIEKMVEATPPRRSDRNGRLYVGPEQSRFSLRYELAAGGADNPVGVDPTDYTPDGGRVLPQLAPPNLDISPGDAVPTTGFGPVSRSWPLRDSLLRAEDRKWLLDPLARPRPRGFDPRFFCAAPLDQRTTEPLSADARLILEGLNPTHARLVTSLPGVTPMLRSVGRRRQLPAFVADTLFIDTDRQIATLTFRAIVPVDHDRLVVTVVSGSPDDEETDCAAMATAELDRSVINGSASAAPNDYTTELDRSAFREALSTGLPFAPSSDPGRSSAPNTADGALPFRPTPPSPQSVRRLSPPPLPPPPSSPAVAPPPSSSAAPPPPPPSSPSPTVLPPPPPLVTAPLPSNSKAALRNELGDRFRKAFGLSAAPEPPAPSPMTTPSSPPAFVPPSPPAFVPSSPPPAPIAVLGAKPPSEALASGALPASVRAASDAAAASVVASEARAIASMASPLEPKREGSLGAPSFARRAVVDLLSFEPTVPSRLRRSPTHAPVLAAVPPGRVHQHVDVAPGEQSAEDRSRIDILRVLSCGTPLGPEEINHAFDALLDDAYDFDIPLFLVEGDVKPTMDEVETLRVATELAKPLAGASKRMQAAVAAATEALSRTAPPVPESAITLYKQLESATSEASLPPRHFADLVDRTLREARSFKKRTLMGAPRIRADLTIGKITLPLYLPEPAASQLPLLPAFPLVALVELRPREDASEQNAAALVALALGRVLRSRK